MTNRPLIIIAEDQPHILMALQHLAQSVDQVQVLTAHDGLDAVHLAMTRRPQLVILSASLPQIDGPTAAQMIHDHWQQNSHSGQIWMIQGKLDAGHAPGVTPGVTPGADPGASPGAGESADSHINHVITHPFDPNLVTDLLCQTVASKPAM